MVAVAPLSIAPRAYPNRTLPFESFRAPVVESMYTRSPTAIGPPAAATSSSYTPFVFTVICDVPAASSDRKSTRLNSSHVKISYAVFCLKKKNPQEHPINDGGD